MSEQTSETPVATEKPRNKRTHRFTGGKKVLAFITGGTWRSRLFRLVLISIIMTWIGSYGGVADKYPVIFGFFHGVLNVVNFVFRWFVTLVRDVFTLKFGHPFTVLGTEVPKLIQQFIDWIQLVAFA